MHVNDCKVETIVLDAVAFLNNLQIQNIAKCAFTTDKVIQEIKDATTLQRLQTLAYPLHRREPSVESLSIIREFARKTGDLQSLSAADIGIMALTLDLEKETKGSLDHIRKEPTFSLKEKEAALHREGKRVVSEAAPVPDAGSNVSEKSNEETVQKMEVNEEELNNEEEEEWETDEEGEEEEEEEEDIGDWITPDNFQAVAAKIRQGADVFGGNVLRSEIPDEKIAVGCLTTDFSMQNVLAQMGLIIVTVDGKRIKCPRSYVLWCSACHHSVAKSGIFFCPKCGHDTLRKIPVSMDENGKLIFHFKKDFRYNLRNTIYTVPTPQGGKYARNPIRFENQPLPQQKARKVKNALVQALDPRLDWDEQNPFQTHTLEGKAFYHGFTTDKPRYILGPDGRHLKPTRGPLNKGRSYKKKR